MQTLIQLVTIISECICQLGRYVLGTYKAIGTSYKKQISGIYKLFTILIRNLQI